jgi:hypothetical protein
MTSALESHTPLKPGSLTRSTVDGVNVLGLGFAWADDRVHTSNLVRTSTSQCIYGRDTPLLNQRLRAGDTEPCHRRAGKANCGEESYEGRGDHSDSGCEQNERGKR